MRLKRLEMVGFKSFAERTRLEFEPGITSVVGPNGCGKSNIADAIRWSLGEMSPRSLRGQQMLDVIFNGTANRPPQGMSEVALTFDNASHKIPLDYTEVTIARRLFRSGESEYFINKTQCRLKDVRDLFLDTGIGSDGYSILQQGEIEFILSAKPEERRELFEEAAGVAKYKVRREETLRKLSKVEQDMLRLNDSLAIYKQQMEALDAAVRKARRHQQLQEELKTLEIAALLRGHQSTQQSLNERRAREEEDSLRLAQLKEDLGQKETAHAKARSDWETLEQQLIDLQKQAAQGESDGAKAEAELQAAREREGELAAAQARLAQEAVQLEASLGEWAARQAGLSSEVAELRKQYHEKHEAFKAEDQKGQADQNACLHLQKDIETTRARLVELARLLSHHRNETVRLTSLAVRYEEAAKAKQREQEKVQQRYADQESQVQRQEQQVQEIRERLRTASDSLLALEASRKKDTETLGDFEKTIQSSREQLARLEAEKMALERWLGRDARMLAAGALVRADLPGIYGPVRELLRTSKPYERLLENALGDRGHFFVARTLNDAQAAIRFLSDERKGWAAFLVLDRLAQSEALLPFEAPGSRSLAEAVQCEEQFQPVVRYLLGKIFYVGNTLFEEGLVCGGADPVGYSAAYAATPADLARLAQAVQEAQATIDAVTASCDQLKRAMADRDAQRAPLAAEAGKIQVASQVQQETLARQREDMQMAETELRILRREKEEALKAVEDTQHNLEQEETLLKNLDDEEKALQQTLHEKDSTLQERRQTAQSHQALVSHLRLEAETTRERLLGKEREEESSRREKDSLEQRLHQSQSDHAENQRRLVQLEDLQVEKTSYLQSLRAHQSGQQKELGALLARRQQIQEDLRRQETELSAGRDAFSEAQARTQEVVFQARGLEQELARHEETLTSSYQLTMDDARAQYGEVSPNPEELVRVKRRLEGLGPVNLAAPEEHAQLEERYHFLLTQQQDLLKAKDDLHQAIAKINATTREQFKVTFEQVRKNFKTLFRTLFQGGEADVVLTDEHNLLESGIDIVAQPPGKKLQNIALLSGGESALTAIALMFAFFMVKPSPFCLMDEVDAPLDEANVGRFLRLVKAFTENVQFIIITHNKRTMEMADVLYGVTMAELGVSTLVSVKLESATPTEVVAA